MQGDIIELAFNRTNNTGKFPFKFELIQNTANTPADSQAAQPMDTQTPHSHTSQRQVQLSQSSLLASQRVFSQSTLPSQSTEFAATFYTS